MKSKSGKLTKWDFVGRIVLVVVGVLMMMCLQESLVHAKSIEEAENYPCRFALEYSIADFYNNSIRAQQFLMNVSHWEGKFATHGVGLNMISGLTYDGHQIDYDTSELHDPLHDFSAASKESLHLDMIALGLNGDKIAMNFFKSSMESQSNVRFAFSAKKNQQLLRSYESIKDSQDNRVQQFILSSLRAKLQSYEKFDNQYPGFGGLLPWFTVSDEGAGLLDGWTDRVPSLDNGQMIWGLIAVEQVLRQQQIGLDLADIIAARIKKLTQTVLPIFYDGNGHVRCVAKIKNIYGSPYNPNNYQSDGSCYLNDPYEGELMDFFIDLKADWAASGYSLDERNKIWLAKRSQTRAVKYKSKLYGDILVEQGFWYSSHEKWKYLMLPYQSVPVNNRIFLNGERARLVNSIENGIPGLFASVTVPVKRGDYSPPYSSACGIAQIASQPIEYTTIVTPYGSFPPVLADQNIGLMWYLTTIQGAKMQGVYGSTESTNITGSAIQNSLLLIWLVMDCMIVSIKSWTLNGQEYLELDHTLENKFHSINSDQPLTFLKIWLTLQCVLKPMSIPNLREFQKSL
ncbi:GPI anchored protein [Naegleria gruberi]|uniref:GPI anchored protein n=1 Tax=Naegleria gruberi TaxID=5762 RepID=D2V8H9_NAEGR|nr:GPI anchored protein [Naegleria gruberi]EFC46688.1 GPI anchored protein [Naegleria gruberi]|eukprot:XP_002679432.1 GPI anchored protein [Naegleria gruberi strain NEG-M]